MFAAGFANLGWMATGRVMVYEATGRHGRTVASLAGGGLLFLAVLVVSSSSQVV